MHPFQIFINNNRLKLINECLIVLSVFICLSVLEGITSISATLSALPQYPPTPFMTIIFMPKPLSLSQICPSLTLLLLLWLTVALWLTPYQNFCWLLPKMFAIALGVCPREKGATEGSLSCCWATAEAVRGGGDCCPQHFPSLAQWKRIFGLLLHVRRWPARRTFFMAGVPQLAPCHSPCAAAVVGCLGHYAAAAGKNFNVYCLRQ